ncbi:DNA-3-methyladenine glycosylase family protein [Lentilactobacillus otakiensis]|uniref:DNA-3-methyladenine glycosylase family protein n=1 Tax=Lentilactobacillus otakiensis TaxID=481720 RepID=UPI003D17A099
MQMKLEAKYPLSVHLTKQIAKVSKTVVANLTLNENEISYFIRFKNETWPVTLRLNADGSGVQVISTNSQPEFQEFLSKQVRNFLSLDDDLAPLYQLGIKDPIFAPIQAAMKGVHQLKFETPFAAGLWAIISTRNSWTNAHNQTQRLLIDNAYPTPTDILKLNKEELGKLINNDRKAGYMLNLAEAFAPSYEADLNLFANASSDTAEAFLKQIKGIGDWSSHFILVRGMGKMDKAPLAEKLNQTTIANFYPGIEPARMLKYYGDLQAYWLLYLRYYSQVSKKIS